METRKPKSEIVELNYRGYVLTYNVRTNLWSLSASGSTWEGLSLKDAMLMVDDWLDDSQTRTLNYIYFDLQNIRGEYPPEPFLVTVVSTLEMNRFMVQKTHTLGTRDQEPFITFGDKLFPVSSKEKIQAVVAAMKKRKEAVEELTSAAEELGKLSVSARRRSYE